MCIYIYAHTYIHTYAHYKYKYVYVHAYRAYRHGCRHYLGTDRLDKHQGPTI